MRDEGEQVSCCSGVVWCCALMASTLRGEEPLPWRQQGCVSQPAMTHAAESASRFAAPKPRWATQNSPPLSSGACFPSDNLSVSLVLPIIAQVIFSRRDNFGQFPPVPSFVGPCRSLPQGGSDDSSSVASLRYTAACDALGGLGMAMLRCLLAGRQVGRRRHVCLLLLRLGTGESCDCVRGILNLH